MNSYTIKLLVFFLSLFLLITISSQIYFAFQPKAETQSAILYSSVEKIPFKGIAVRNETVIDYSGGGVVNYPYPDGSRIAKNSVVANIYASETDILNKQKISQLTNEVTLLEKAQNNGTTLYAQPDFLAGLIQQKYQEITASVQENNLVNVSEQRSELLKLMNIMQIVIKKETDYNDRIATLKEQISSLSATTSEPIASVSITDPGYFVSYTDGYESQLSLDTIDTLSAEQVKAFIANYKESNTASPTAIGKMIDDYRWEIITVLDNSKKNLTAGVSVQIQFPTMTEPVDAKVEKLADTENPKESVVILSCDKLTYQLVQHRIETAEILLNNFEGIRVPREAIRFYNNEKGVYVKLGEQILFRKIDVIYEGKDYVLTKRESKSGYLAVYDDIVTEGVDASNVVFATQSESNTSKEPQPTELEESSGTIVVGTTTAPKASETAKPVASSSVKRSETGGE